MLKKIYIGTMKRNYFADSNPLHVIGGYFRLPISFWCDVCHGTPGFQTEGALSEGSFKTEGVP